MTAKEYYNNQDRFEYFTKLTNTGISDDFDEIMAFAKAYHEHKLKLLGIADVSQQRELLLDFLSKVNGNLITHPHLQMNTDFVEDYLKSNNCG